MKLAVIGKDVSKSDSPKIHKFIAEELNLEMSYESVSIPEENFSDRIEDIFSEYDGFNVTIPFKLSVIPYLKRVEGDAKAFGAVNTVVSKNRTGYNTDGLGFMQMLSAEGIELKGKSVLLLGAGGAGRSVAKKLIDAGAFVQLYDRKRENAENVLKEFGHVKVLTEVLPEKRDIIINATGVGMHKTEGVSPVGEEIIAPCGAAVDLIYVPAQSEFLRIAACLNKKTVNGAAMLFYQAYYSDCFYFGMQAKPETAKKLFEKYIREH